MENINESTTSSNWIKAVAFSIISIISLLAIVCAFLLEADFSRFSPHFIEPILLTTMMTLNVSGWLILFSPEPRLARFLIPSIAAASVTIAIAIRLWTLSYMIGLPMVLFSTIGVLIIQNCICTYKPKGIGVRILISGAFFVVNILIWMIASHYFLIPVYD